MSAPTIPAGWPCALLPAVPPSVADRQSNPTADDLLPQVLALTPRGAAWGRDEAGDGKGAGPVMLRFWRAVASWVADVNARDHEVARQTFPSATTISLADWETELGLPDTCTPAPGTIKSRIAAVRARFGAQGGASPAYFVCLAHALGYAITIEEPTGFMVDVSELIGGDVTETWFVCSADGLAGSVLGIDGDPLETFILPVPVPIGDELVGAGISETWFATGENGSELGIGGDPLEGYLASDPAADVWGSWVVHLVDPTLSWFTCAAGDVVETWFVCSADGTDGSVLGIDGDPLQGFAAPALADAGSVLGIDGDPLEAYTPARDLECELRRLCPPHTDLTFSYDLATAA